MIERAPLKDIQNESFTRQKVQRTYGRRTKAATTMASAKEIFTATCDLEESLQHLTISDEKENAVQQGGNDEVGQPIDIMSKKVRPSKRYIQPSTAPQIATVTITTSTTTKSGSETRSQKPKIKKVPTRSNSKNRSQPRSRQVSEDDSAIQDLASKYSDRNILSFEKYGNTIAKACDVKKVGEGAYSSVFALTRKNAESTPRSTPSQCSDGSINAEDGLYSTTILKMMPIAPPSQPDLEGQTLPYHIANELQTMQLMDSVHGFIRYRSLIVVKGSWPSNFLEAFRRFKNTCRKKAENEDPATAYGEDQHYALIEMEDAGAELSDVIKRPSDFQIYDIFWQTAIHLSIAEAERQFEHRDLHVSNICIKPDVVDGTGRIDLSETTASTMTEPPSMVLGLSNISVTLIDYTFSRLSLPADSDHDEHGTQQTNFREFALEGDDYDTLLAKTLTSKEQKRIGNSGERFEDRMQQLTYAKVAKIVNAAYEQVERDGQNDDAVEERHVAPWEQRVPRSNVCWLGYLLSCLLARAGKTAKTKCVVGSNLVAKAVQDGLRRKMLGLKELLLEEDIGRMLGSAADVVNVGVQKGWLSVEEINAFKARLEEDS